MIPSLLACGAGLVTTLVGEGTGVFALRAVGKTVASLAFLGFALALGLQGVGPHGVAMVVALVLSVVGDVLLLGTAKPAFLAGLGAFLLAHVAYAVAFVLLGPWWPVVAGAALPLAGVAWAVWRWLGPHVGRLRGPVLAYVSVITAMVALACGAGLTGDGVRAWLVPGAFLFWASDLFVARQRFLVPTPVNRYVGLPLYYAAQLVLAWAGSLA
jgi:uncharacterized membrane protein YhhN